MIDINNFDAIEISLASSKQIRSWSSGEVTKPETINYRTLKPEKDGLFCERIFGPTKDWECYCGKYKRVRYKGIVCERCGVEVTRSKVRRERMGHIDLAAPVSHIWFFKGVPSRIGYLLDIAPKELEKVLYFAASMVTWIDEEARAADLGKLEKEVDKVLDAYEGEKQERTQELREALDRRLEYLKSGKQTGFNDEDHLWADALEINVKKLSDADREKLEKDVRKAFDQDINDTEAYIEDAAERMRQAWEKFQDMSVKEVIADEALFRELKDRFGSPFGWGEYFRGGMGAEHLRDLLEQVNLDAEAEELELTIKSSKGQKQNKAIKRLKVVSAFRNSKNRPDWMILEAVPVIPPELRPMVQLDGGRFATSDLNDLYRRVINRNNRLKRLLDLGAPEIIVNNEKRMLQEAVDALFDNGRRGRPVTGPGNRALKSLSDMLKGKQGRFRQNLLGKRVDYSGRSVIVAGPSLKLHQCGLPKLMALELFKPFIMARLVERKAVQNIKAAKKMVESMIPEVWDVLEEVISEHPVLLNRAPTLHRLGIQAFEPVLVEGKAIQIHPLVCHAFNADFDGDQMAVHVPAQLRGPGGGAHPDAVGQQHPVAGTRWPAGHAVAGHGAGRLLPHLRARRPRSWRRWTSRSSTATRRCSARPRRLSSPTTTSATGSRTSPSGARRRAITSRRRSDASCSTTASSGRWPERSTTRPSPRTTRSSTRPSPSARSARWSRTWWCATALRGSSLVLDAFKELGFHYASKAGITISKNDIDAPPEKEAILEQTEKDVEEVQSQYEMGLITNEERREKVIDKWTAASDQVAKAVETNLHHLNPIYMMANSGARGSFTQIRQLAGMRGLMANPKGEIIEEPIKASFMEGLTVLEYFISTHGARKGLADTALRTADSGYLTRRLVDVAQDVIVRLHDCKTRGHIEMPLNSEDGRTNTNLIGRVSAAKLATKRGRELLKKNEVINRDSLRGDRRGLRRREGRRDPGALGAEVRGRDRRVLPLLRRRPRKGRPVRPRRRGRDRGGAVDR